MAHLLWRWGTHDRPAAGASLDHDARSPKDHRVPPCLKTWATRLPESHRKTYQKIHLPHVVYVRDFYKKDPRTEGEIVGEMLIDATAPAYAHDHSLVAMRLNDVLILHGNGLRIIVAPDHDPGAPILAPRNEAPDF